VDPKACLEEILSRAQSIQQRQSEGYKKWQIKNHIEDGERLAELVIALNGWLTKGGFLPQPWQDGQEQKRLADEIINEVIAEEKEQ
jgi:hypothetical protein